MTTIRNDERIPVGIWAQWPRGARWSNEGMTRLLGFLIEGIAQGSRYTFRIVLPDWIRDEAEADLRALAATYGRDYSLYSPRDFDVEAETMPDVLDFANTRVPVAGWLSIFPSFNLAKGLEGHLAVIFPDAIPKVFHEFSEMAWGRNGNHAVWEEYVRGSVDRADRLITFSKHVRDRQLRTVFGVFPERVSVVPHASPDLLPNLDFLDRREASAESRAEAGAMLRDHAALMGWDYLRNYPFEEVPYVAVSTQDRVTKNIRLILDSVLRLIRHDRRDLRILSTAPLHFGADWTPLPSTIEKFQAHRDLVSMPDLPREEHAALYHCAALAVHASIFEGGHAPFPFYEAVSVGTPCLMARGPHVEELIEGQPALGDFVFDPNDADGLARMIVRTLDARDDALRIQSEVYENLRRRSWSDVANAYADAAVGKTSTPEPTMETAV